MFLCCYRPNGPYLRMTWLGHASVLAEVDGKAVLTDPIFSNRASLVQVKQFLLILYLITSLQLSK